MAGQQRQTAVDAGLLADAKNYLDITWEDASTDTKLTGILDRGMIYLDHVAGATLDYAEEGLARALLFDYARYARENALDIYSTAFVSELLMLHQLNIPEEEAEDDA